MKEGKAKSKAKDGDETRLESAVLRKEDVDPERLMKRNAYEAELKKLHVELVKLQEWVRHEGRKVCIVFEGRDGAGKGGTIKAIRIV